MNRPRRRPRTRLASCLAVLVSALALGALPHARAAPSVGPPPESLTIHETGLPDNTPWFVILSGSGSGQQYQVNGTTFSRTESPGVYHADVLPVGVYEPNESSHDFQLFNAPGYWNFTFVKNGTIIYDNNSSPPAPDSLFGIPTGELEFIGAVGAIAVISAAWIALAPGRRRRKPPKPEPEKGPKRKANSDEDDDPESAERRKARRERREGVRRDRGRPKPAAPRSSDDALDDDATD